MEEENVTETESWSSSGVFRPTDGEPQTRALTTFAKKLDGGTIPFWQMAIEDSGNTSFTGVVLWPTIVDPDGKFANRVHASVTSLLSNLPSEPIEKYMTSLHKITDLS